MDNNNTSPAHETRPPVLPRRRLSVPETIMRKHSLALEKAKDNKNWEQLDSSSDPNLIRKRDFNIIRKSTLLRRLWSDNKPPRLSGSFQEWQHSCKKMPSTQSLNSNHSSPERLRKSEPKVLQRKFSSSPIRLSSNSPKRKKPASTCSTNKYTGSSFTNVSDSDSAYSNSISNLDSPMSSMKSKKDASSNISVQTRDVTNLNVISNVTLRQSTLDLIFKEVMKDVNNQRQRDISISTATVTTNDNSSSINQSSFFLGLSSDQQPPPPFDLENFMISKVRAGSPYIKPADICTDVPRFSAVPRTSSMEVNTSEEDTFSEAGSFADSLENSISPRNQTSRRSSSDVTQLLPEGKKEFKKSSSFFIPIVNDENGNKAVAELLPSRVREKLNERQQKRKEKTKLNRTGNVEQPSIRVIKNDLSYSNYFPKKRAKPILPSIASLKKSSSRERRPSVEYSRILSSQSTSKAVIKEKKQVSKVESITSQKRKDNKEKMDDGETNQNGNKKQSKIPEPARMKTAKPFYLDMENENSDSKVDRLIANILIDSLNRDLQTAEHQDQANANNIGQNIETAVNRKVSSLCNADNNGNSTLKGNSSIPKGWVTVYTVHKDLESPESTSDEGKRNIENNKEVREDISVPMREISYDNQNSGKNNNPLFRNKSYETSLNTFDTVKNTACSDKREDSDSKKAGDWSVTISGCSKYGQMTPDLEMRLKFRKKYRSSSNSSTEKENSQRTCAFPQIRHNQRVINLERRYSKGRNTIEESLPKIQTAHRIGGREDSVLSLAPSVILPRQNKTSTSRYYFSRPRGRYSLPDVPSMINDRQYNEIMKRIPDLLAVTGRSISSERRSYEET